MNHTHFVGLLKMYKLLLCFVISVKTEVVEEAKTVTVTTSNGDLVGQMHDGYNTFFGVPYAKVKEDNPYTASVPYPYFGTPFIANDPNIMCPQYVKPDEIGGTLQCLRLNIYVPQTDTKKRAILVWFPGKSFKFGHAGTYGGQHLAKKDIIVVIANYRLGPYGFFCMQELDMPGNQGLRDQVDALRWVQKEIAAFDGDPHEVTIGGQGIGAGFVDLHLYSEYANEDILFDKAILQSGSVLLKGVFHAANPRAVVFLSEYLGRRIGKLTHPRDVIKFVCKFSPNDIIKAVTNMDLQFGVCRERNFKSFNLAVHGFNLHDPFHLTAPTKASHTKFLIGYNSMELLFAFADKDANWTNTHVDELFCERLSLVFSLQTHERDQLCKITKKFYLGSDTTGTAVLAQLIESGSDFFMNHVIERTIEKLVQAEATVYKYLFSYTGGSAFNHVVPNAGASHGEEMKYLFDLKTSPIEGQEQHNIRKKILKLWSNFIKFGNPTPLAEREGNSSVSWTPLTKKERPYLNIDVNTTLKNSLLRQRMAFWDLLWFQYEPRALYNEGV